MLIGKTKTVFVASAGKAKHLEPLKSNEIEIWTRTKDDDHNKKLFQDLIGVMKECGSTVGKVAKDKYEGAFVSEWNEALQAAGEETFTWVDIANVLASVMEVKDEEELRAIRAASKASTALMTKYVADEMTTIIDEERKITHSAFTDKIENKIDDERFFKKKDLKLPPEFDPTQLDWCYSPVVQSGGKYDLKPSAVSDDSRLEPGVILCSLGMRYKAYCSNIARTYLIDPTKQQEANYTLLLGIQQRALEAIKDGAVCKDVYNAAIEYIREKSPEMEKYFVKNVGWGIGIDFRDTTLLLTAKNEHPLRDGMSLNLLVGFNDIPNPEGTSKRDASYSLLLIDTVRVTTDDAIVFTDSDKSRKEVSFYFKQDDDAKPERPKRSVAIVGANTSAAMRAKMRQENKREVDDNSDKKRQLKQRELHDKLQKNGEGRFAEGDSKLLSDQKVEFKKYESYKRPNQLPPQVKDLRIHVDARAQTIILPINGRPVPFHINAYKNGSKFEEGEYCYLRLNFQSPGGVGKKDDMPFEDPDAQFVKSLTFRSRDVERMSDVLKQISDLKRESVKRETERKEMEDVVTQGNLIEVKNRRPAHLESVFIRPGPEGKRVTGRLEIHQNGVRYVALEQKIDILFSNVQHLFFQPCDNELIVLIHFHLKNPIMIGKRKTKDVQIYREAADMAFDETGNKKRRYRYGDEDELEQEQEERRRRAALNKEFKNFSEQIAEATNGLLDVDIPFRDLGFEGVPFRTNVLLQPTTECLVQLIDPPFLVVNLSEVELAHLERVAFGLKQFDMVLVYKDYTKPVTHINSIPMVQLDSVKDWLTETDVPFYEGQVNLNWATIMKTVTTDPHEFFSSGGWSFLSTESGDEASDGEESPEESEFEVSDEDPDDESEEEEYSEDESDFDDGSEAGSEEESGDDWDDLESEARLEDAKEAQLDRKRKR
jgi:nucleosome binding factor SPN SPT16 subunit